MTEKKVVEAKRKGWRVIILTMVVREDLVEKISFEQSSEDEGVSHVSHVTSILGKVKSKCGSHMDDTKNMSCDNWP